MEESKHEERDGRKKTGGKEKRKVNYFSVDISFSVASDKFWHLMTLNIIFISLRLGLWFTKG